MIKFRNLKKGDKLSETQYYTVEKVQGNKVQLKNILNENIVVDKEYVETCLTSGDQFETEAKVNKTDLTKIFLENPNTVFSVSFNKKVKETEVVKEVMDAYEGSSVKTMETAIKKAVKRALNGEERVLVGYHNGQQDDFGRVSAVDMNINDSSPLRLVDPRELNFLILKGTKYTVK